MASDARGASGAARHLASRTSVAWRVSRPKALGEPRVSSVLLLMGTSLTELAGALVVLQLR